MFMRGFFMSVVLLAAVLLPLNAMAAGKAASIDYQQILKEAPQIKASRKIVEQEYSPRKKALQKRRKKTLELLKEYRGMGPGTNSLERASAAEKLRKSRKKLQQMSRQYSSGLQMRNAQVRANFKETLEEEVSLYAQLHGFTVVLKSGVAYAGQSVDITDEILALLKRDYRQAQASDNKEN